MNSLCSTDRIIYDDIIEFMNKSINISIRIGEKYGLTAQDVKAIRSTGGKWGVDFFPTPNDCVERFYGYLPKQYTKNASFLEGSAGLGSVSYWFHKKYPEMKIQSNELSDVLFEYMDKILPTNIERTNMDFFDINQRYDYIFLNPPFAKKIWVKFLLHTLQMLNSNAKTRDWGYDEMRLFLIVPKSKGIEKDIVFDNWRELIKALGIPNKCFVDFVNELSGKNFKLSEFKKYMDDDDYNDDDDSIVEYIKNKHYFTFCDYIGDYKGFGGTFATTSMFVIDIFR